MEDFNQNSSHQDYIVALGDINAEMGNYNITIWNKVLNNRPSKTCEW